MTNTAGVRGKEQFVRRDFPQRFVPVFVLIVALTTDAAEVAAPKFLGAQSCANSMCHGGAGDKRDQYVTWLKKDFHTRAPATLSMSRSTRIAETLKIADATTSARCTECHNPFQAVPAERKGPLVGKLEGVSCESCHNAAENWLLTHTRTDLSHGQKVAAGMRDLKNLYVRANTCVACHQNLDPELSAAGHPELTFELDGQCVAMPRHWPETNRLRGAQAWLVGQAVAAREAAAQTNGPQAIWERGSALSAVVGTSAVDQMARAVAAENWTRSQAWQQLVALASKDESISLGKASATEIAMRAERITLGLERLLVALDMHKHPALSPKLDQLFKDVQSRPDFSPVTFAEHLKSFSAELAKLPKN